MVHTSHRLAWSIASSVGFTSSIAFAVPVAWLGGAGNWYDNTQWNTGVAPNSPTGTPAWDVTIDSPPSGAVTLAPGSTILTTRVNSLAIGTGNMLAIGSTVGPAHTLRLDGSLTVDGTLQLTGGSDGSKLSLPSTSTLAGNGLIEFTGYHFPSSILSVGAVDGLTVGAGLTLRGSGTGETLYSMTGASIGSQTGPLTNHGRIVVSPTGVLGLRGTSYVNTGSIELEGGILNFVDPFDRSTLGDFDHARGTVVIGSRLENVGQTLKLGTPGSGGAWIAKGTIHGGTLRGAGGVLYVPYLSTAVLDGVTLADDATIAISGSVTLLNGTHGHGTIRLANAEAIEGTGIINTEGMLPAGMTVRGAVSEHYPTNGYKGRVVLTRNEGRIRVENGIFGAGKLYLSGPSITNAGTFEISAGNTLQVMGTYGGGSPFANAAFDVGGTLVVDGGGLLSIPGSLDLSLSDLLTVLPKSDGTAYQDERIVLLEYAAYGVGTLSGMFDSVTPGITVRYATDGIFISGAPVPEPTTLLAFVSIGLLSRRRRRGA